LHAHELACDDYDVRDDDLAILTMIIGFALMLFILYAIIMFQLQISFTFQAF